ARREGADLAVDFLVRDPLVVSDAALARDPQLFEDRPRTVEGEAVRPSQRAGEILDDAPVLARLARTVHRLVDLDDAPLDLSDRPFVFLLQAPGKDDIGVAGRVV